MRSKLVGGALIWALGLGTVGVMLSAHAEQIRGPASKLARYAVGGRQAVETTLRGPLGPGDPVLTSDRHYVGRVISVRGDAQAWLAQGEQGLVLLELDPEVELPAGLVYTARTTPTDGRWIYETLLPPEKQEYVFSELRAFAAANEAEISSFVRPVAEDALEHAIAVFQANLKPALEKREGEIHALLDEHRGMVRDDVLPVLKKQLGPSAKEKFDPVVREIGRELWDELPMWSVGWRAAFDVLPWAQGDRVDRWWKDFVDTKAIPIISAHEAELLKVLEDLIEEGANDPEVRAALGKATQRLAADPRLRQLIRGVLEDALVRPLDVVDLVQTLWNDPEHRARRQALERRLQPVLRRIGHKLTVDPETGRIDPDLTRVLRRVVFEKDQRWVEASKP
ncbi:MAG: hypothetical protein KDD82_22505 [Planctomycetes bacterium]|nr:hypothetical protein [Planctomycetota bacterium]